MADFDPNAQPGNAGELHQRSGARHPALTTNQGVPISDDQNSLRAGARGPVLLEDGSVKNLGQPTCLSLADQPG